jgi:hypothetical protein
MKSANAAAEAARLSREAIATDRAWLTVDLLEYMEVKDFTIDGVPVKEGFSFRPRWLNSGRSPAIKAKMFDRHAVIAIDADPPTFTAAFENDSSATIIGPAIKVTGPWRGIGGDEWDRFRNNVDKIIVYSAAEYFDVFNEGTRHFTDAIIEFRFSGFFVDKDGRKKVRVDTRSIGAQRAT